jgi:putative SOS response-associated peptidase YedK
VAGLEGIDASKMEIIDALGGTRWAYDEGERVAKPLLRHADFAPVAIVVDGERVIEKVRFGMPGFQGRLITNARDDKLAESPSWRSLFGKSHSLTAISYVVETDKKTKTTYRVQRRDGKLMVVPGLVARRHLKFASTGNEYDDLCHVQVTADANDFVATIHDRFVCELESKKERDMWMDPADHDVGALAKLLVQAPNDRYEMVPIASDAWKRRDDPEATRPIGEAVTWSGVGTKNTDSPSRVGKANEKKVARRIDEWQE